VSAGGVALVPGGARGTKRAGGMSSMASLKAKLSGKKPRTSASAKPAAAAVTSAAKPRGASVAAKPRGSSVGRGAGGSGRGKRKRGEEGDWSDDEVESRVVNDRTSGWGDETQREVLIESVRMERIMARGGGKEAAAVISADAAQGSQARQATGDNVPVTEGGVTEGTGGEESLGYGVKGVAVKSGGDAGGKRPPKKGYVCIHCSQPGGEERSHWSEMCTVSWPKL
jgi:hypothetical protein